MFIEAATLLALIDRLIQLVKQHEEISRNLFTTLIQPTFQAFEAVHTDYIDSLTRYSTRLSDVTLPMNLDHPVFSDIELDSLRTAHFRTKLADFHPKKAGPKLMSFLTAIDTYLQGLSAAGAHVELFKKMIDGNKSLTLDDLDGLIEPDSSYDEQHKDGRLPEIVLLDPMRMALRRVLVGFDAAQPSSPEDDRLQLTEGAAEWLAQTDAIRRLECSVAIRAAMDRFQSNFATVSAEYAKLREALI
jgi:hypothetical protein